MAAKSVFRKIAQVGLVVRDLEEAMKKQWEQHGIGPWSIHTFSPDTVTEMSIRGEKVEHAMRIGIAMIGDIMWELIQPLDDRSIYAEHLREHGEGLHHVLFEVEDFEKAVEQFKDKGIGVLQGGNWQGLKYAYFDTRGSLSMISEIYSPPGDGAGLPEPEATYP